MPGGAAPNDNLLIAGSQRDPLADRCCHGADLAHLGLSGTAGVQSSRNRNLTCGQAR
jgi:hypothetical protein